MISLPGVSTGTTRSAISARLPKNSALLSRLSCSSMTIRSSATASASASPRSRSGARTRSACAAGCSMIRVCRFRLSPRKPHPAANWSRRRSHAGSCAARRWGRRNISSSCRSNARSSASRHRRRNCNASKSCFSAPPSSTRWAGNFQRANLQPWLQIQALACLRSRCRIALAITDWSVPPSLSTQRSQVSRSAAGHSAWVSSTAFCGTS